MASEDIEMMKQQIAEMQAKIAEMEAGEAQEPWHKNGAQAPQTEEAAEEEMETGKAPAPAEAMAPEGEGDELNDYMSKFPKRKKF